MKKILISAAIILTTSTLFCQEALKTNEEDYYNFLALKGLYEYPTTNYRTLSDNEWLSLCDNNENHPLAGKNLGNKYSLVNLISADNWFTNGLNKNLNLKIYGPEWFNSYNTKQPYGQNDGGLWQGKGYNTSLSAGLRAEAAGFAFTFKPQLSWSQNKDFAYREGVYNDKHSYFWNGYIDLVQRYGDTAFWNYDWGDTEVRFNWYNFTVGFGFQSPWLGPAYMNPMLGSNNAGTYPKIDLGLRRTDIIIPYLGWNIGTFEGRIWTGRLTASDYFYPDVESKDRMLHGISLSFEPSFIPGMYFGVNRIFILYWKPENIKYIGRLFTLSRDNALSSSGNDEDQKVALNMGWRFPQIGFEFYGEFGIDDFSSEEVANPFHTGIYTVGGKQYIPLNFSKLNPKFKNIDSELILEWSNFEMSQDFQLQWGYMGYYGHGFVKEGYTNNGQIIGAGYGYAGNSQYAAWKFYYSKGYIMPYFHRFCPDNNFIYNKAVYADGSKWSGNDINKQWYAVFKTFCTVGLKQSIFVTNSLCLDSAFCYSLTFYPEWDVNNRVMQHFRLELSGKYNF